MRKFVLPTLTFLYVNLLFTFENVPSSPALRPVAKVSIEALVLAALVAGLVALGFFSRGVKIFLSVGVLWFAIVRYVDVTAFGVLGRGFDLHGDFPHLHRVFAMFWEAMSPATALFALLGFALVLAFGLTLNWFAFRVWEQTLEDRSVRRGVVGTAVLIAVLFWIRPPYVFGLTTAGMVVRQFQTLRSGEAEKLAAAEIDWPVPSLGSDLERLEDANVVLIFLESYGVTLIEDAHHRDVIEPRFRALERSLSDVGYAFASSQIQSPTFGGGSWRAHATLLSGVHVESEHFYNALVDSDRETLVSVLSRNGYRTVAVEPGIKWYWPDGQFYGFNQIYAFDELDYRGPPMGWWKIPDQFTLWRLYQEELSRPNAKVFAKVSLIMTHIPYYPIPPYVADWSRFSNSTAFESGLKSVAHDAYRDLGELSTWYLEAFRYELDVLEGFLVDYVPDNTLVIVVGDHQPPKLATHDNNSWAVPMHVMSKNERLVRAFDGLGFEPGLMPMTETSFRMADFLEGFLEAYDSDAAAATEALATDQ